MSKGARKRASKAAFEGRRGEPSSPYRQSPERRLALLAALALFLVSLAIRLLFWQATADRAWAWTATYKGDAPLWLEYAGALRLGQPFELGLPIHTPGAACLLARVWNGDASGLPFARFVWVVVSALVPPLVLLSVARSFGLRVAVAAGALCAASTSLLVLGASLNNETPYLFLVSASFLFVEDLLGGADGAGPRHGALAIWSVLNAVACLFRVEHLLFYLPALVLFATRWKARAGPVAASLLCFAVPLVPWHLEAWRAIRRFNEQPAAAGPAEEAALGTVERRLAGIPWDADALGRRDELPAFARRTSSAFVLATVAYRGGERVRGADFGILEEAFGTVPRPLARFPFVTSYGPLNFALGNHAGATGGFDRGPLEEPPPLAGGADRYPPFLVSGLPPPRLTFVYPPHVRLFNDGYAIGGRWIASHAGDFLALAARKLAIFWSGAATCLTGWGLPLGLSGPRRAVDMVAAEGPGATLWRVALLVLVIVGAVAGRCERALHPWHLFLAGKLAMAVLFFGYARQGAVAVPAVALLVALAARPLLDRMSLRAAATALALAVALEAGRFASRPTIRIDGTLVEASDPVPPDDPRAVSISIR